MVVTVFHACLQTMPVLYGTAFTLSGTNTSPQGVMRDKKDVMAEQQRVMATIKMAEAVMHQVSASTLAHTT